MEELEAFWPPYQRSPVEYHLTFDDIHKLTISAKGSPDNKFRITDTQIDLGKTNLFTGPAESAETRGTSPRALLPLAAETRAAFDLLDQAPQHSPIVAALLKFRTERLPHLIAQLENPPSPPIIPEQIFASPENSEKSRRALVETIARINRELPHYFSSEKAIGTFPWLKGGAQTSKLPVTLAEETSFSPDSVRDGAQLLVECSGRYTRYDANKDTAYVLSSGAPSAATVFASLCNSGTLGSEFVELNHGVLLREVAHPISSNARMLKELAEIRESQLKTPVRSKIMTIIQNGAPGAIAMTIIGAPVIAHAVQNALTPIDLFRTVLATGLGYLFGRTIQLGLRNRESKIELQREYAEKKKAGQVDETIFDPSDASLMSIFSTALVDHTLSSSAGNARLLLAPKSVAEWRALIPRLAAPDPGLMPSSEVDFLGMKMRVPEMNAEDGHRLEIEMHDDFSGHEIDPREIPHLAFVPTLHIHHIERASETWNMFHAVSLIREFAERQKIPAKGAPWFDLNEALKESLSTATDTSLTYPSISQAFSKLTSYFKLNRESWNVIARALLGASVLERIDDSRRAQEIAREVYGRHFGADH